MLGRVSSFLTAEEVPRWFGLSIVLIYLVGLGAVARYGITETRRSSREQLAASAQYAADALVRELGWSFRPGHDLNDVAPAVRLALRRFEEQYPGSMVNIYDAAGKALFWTGDAPIANLSNAEAFESLPSGIAHHVGAPSSREDDPHMYRGKTLSAQAGWNATNSASTHLLLEIQVPVLLSGAGFADQVGLMIVFFIVLGALFVVYRCLREQLRNVSCIANRLRSQSEGIQQDLLSLRIADERDTAASAWNKLVELAQLSLDQERRQEADAELSRVLANSGGGILADALHAVPDGLLLITEEDRFDYANEAGCRLLGWETSEVKRYTVSDIPLRKVGEKVVALLRSALQPEGRFLPCSDVVQIDNGGEEPSVYRVWIMPVVRAHHDGECLVVIRDITQQSRADRAREELIAQVTHELRTPLTNIRAYSETLSSGMFDDPKVVTECYNVINKETRRLSRLIEDMLNVSQLEVGTIELEFDQVDLRTLLSDAVQDVRGLADEKNIDVQMPLPAKLEPIRADRDKLAVVINNLLGNAIKYTGENGHVIVGCQINTDSATITVKDNGFGISEKDQAKIFEKFYRADDESVQAESGTGIGLYTAREIARRHGGDIELLSAKGEGSTFMIKLPHQGTRATNLSTAESV
ncbi:MAG: sensor histidine kinase [Planctomycetota bacterium]